MSVGPLGGIAGSVAGSPLSQTHGNETQRAQQETSAQQRRVDSDRKAEAASGIGETDGEDHETAERDADGRRPWEGTPEESAENVDDSHEPTDPPPRGRDATGQSGNLLDLSG